MKTACYLLSFLVLFLSTIPSCCEDACDDELATTQSDLNHSDHDYYSSKGSCSPFLTCGSCTGFVMLKSAFELKELTPIAVKTRVTYKPSYTDYFAASIWQPPKLS